MATPSPMPPRPIPRPAARPDPEAGPDPFTIRVMRHAHAARQAIRRGDVHGYRTQLQAIEAALFADSQTGPDVVERN